MEVEVVLMRRHGVRLQLAHLTAATPIYGTLSVMRRLGRSASEEVIVATLVGNPPWPTLLPVLDHCRLTKLQGESFILFGLEEV